MIDREARNRMVAAIQSYMDESIASFQFDKTLRDIENETEDETVQIVSNGLWYYYNDLTDHKIVASKEEWNCFNRLLLLLESDGELETIASEFQWHVNQAIAALFFLVFLAMGIYNGFSDTLFLYAIPLGLPSMLLAWLNSHRNEVTSMETALEPYPSVTSLLAVRRSVHGFKKKHYPKALNKRKLRDPITEALMQIVFLVCWSMFSPVVLFFQMLPERMVDTRIKMP